VEAAESPSGVEPIVRPSRPERDVTNWLPYWLKLLQGETCERRQKQAAAQRRRGTLLARTHVICLASHEQPLRGWTLESTYILAYLPDLSPPINHHTTNE